MIGKNAILEIRDRENRRVTQAGFNALMSQLDKMEIMREALKLIGCRAIPTGNSKNCNCIVHRALR